MVLSKTTTRRTSLTLCRRSLNIQTPVDSLNAKAKRSKIESDQYGIAYGPTTVQPRRITRVLVNEGEEPGMDGL